MKTLLLFGATGQVGQDLLRLALQNPEIETVVAPTRQRLAPHPKLQNPIIDFDKLPATEPWWSADMLLCTLGTTLRQAKSKAGFYRVDHDYILSIASLGFQAGTPTFGLVSSLGADANSRVFYSRVKGETEIAVSAIGFTSLSIIRPSLLLSQSRPDRRPVEACGQWIGRHFGNYWPQKYRPVTTLQVAQALLAHGLMATPGIQVIESENLFS